MKTKPKKRADIRTPVNKLKGKGTIEHYNAVLLEEINSNMKVVAAATEDTKNSLKQEITEFRKEVNGRFEIVEAAITEHSKQIRGLSGKVESLEHKVDKIAVSIESQETRLTVVEEKIESHLAVHP